MTRFVPILSFGCLAAIGATAYAMLDLDRTARIAAPKAAAAAPAERSGLDAELDLARRAGTREALDAVVAKLRQHAEAAPQDRDGWRRLGEGLLLRALQRGHLLGMRPGRPVYGELPTEVAADLDAAEAALDRARRLGDDSGDLHRVTAEVLSQRITGLGSALQWNGRIEAAIAAASERAREDPRLQVVLGLRKLMAPAFLGQDPAQALEHFTYAAEAMAGDERPAIYAAMASYLQQKRLDAIAWLERAVARNPRNVFAQAVLRRVRRGEDDPFGRDVTAAEATALASAAGK